jgi:GNAT superfamily N-acetyltransferase
VVGGAILALRPSVRAGGYVGTIDLLVVDPEHDADRITEALLEELLRSASNKGCVVVEADRPDDDETLARWSRMGFGASNQRIQKSVAAAGSAARRPS